MSRRAEGQLFIGRLSKSTRTRDLEEIFEQYGRMARCEIKYGAEMAYGFVDYEDRRDAEDALKYENGRDVCGSSIIVEWAKGGPRRPQQVNRVTKGYDECYKCHRVGHWARDCPDDKSYGYRRPRKSSRRSRSRDRRSRSRSRSRSRDRKNRSRSRSPRRRSRSRDRKPRRRSPSRSASRSRSRSMDRKEMSRSRSFSPERRGENGMQKQQTFVPGASRSRSRSRSRSLPKA